MTLYRRVITSRGFGRSHGLHLHGQAVYLNLITLKIRAVRSFETPGRIPATTRRHLPKYPNLTVPPHENLTTLTTAPFSTLRRR
jgi:hypothetical protein